MALTDYKPVNISPTPPVPFQIKKSSGENDTLFYVDNGVCFSSFSFDTGTFVPIQGLGSGFSYSFDKNKKFFINFSILKNLQVSGAQIQCEIVGKSGTHWKGYPNMIDIQPQDEVDENGRVVKLIDGKTQTNCYVLIGYREDDVVKNIGSTGSNSTNEEEEKTITPRQILDTNIILLASVVSGVPVVFPAPYFNGLAHLGSNL